MSVVSYNRRNRALFVLVVSYNRRKKSSITSVPAPTDIVFTSYARI